MTTPPANSDLNEFRHTGRVVTSVIFPTKPTKGKERPKSLWSDGQPPKLKKKSSRSYSDRYYRPSQSSCNSNTCKICNGYEAPIPCRDDCAICRCDQSLYRSRSVSRGPRRYYSRDEDIPPLGQLTPNGVVKSESNGTQAVLRKYDKVENIPKSTVDSSAGAAAGDIADTSGRTWSAIPGNICSVCSIILTMGALFNFQKFSDEVVCAVNMLSAMLLIIQQTVIWRESVDMTKRQQAQLYDHACLLCHNVFPAAFLAVNLNNSQVSYCIVAVLYVLCGATRLSLPSKQTNHAKSDVKLEKIENCKSEFGVSSWFAPSLCALVLHVRMLIGSNISSLMAVLLSIMAVVGFTGRLRTKVPKGQEVLVCFFYHLGLTTSCLIITFKPEPNLLGPSDIMTALDTFTGQSVVIHSILFYFCCAKHVKLSES